MSYSVSSKCHRCTKQADCADHVVIQKAVETIHNLPCRWDGNVRVSAHQGGGVITIDCTYGFVDKEINQG